MTLVKQLYTAYIAKPTNEEIKVVGNNQLNLLSIFFVRSYVKCQLSVD